MNITKIIINAGHVLNTPILVWILLGFSVSYLLFFVRPVFLNPAQVMQFFTYVPAADSIGIDLKQAISYSESWFVAKQTPYIGNNLYPPLASVLFTPLLLVDFSTAYTAITYINLLCYLFITLIFPWRLGQKHRNAAVLMLVFLTGLFSYGFQFEIERGQFNVIAISLSLLAIWIYHYHHRQRYWAYFLFTIAIQLKVFPVIFMVMLISNWADWKNNIKRCLGLAAVNFGLLFVLGRQNFVTFIKTLTAEAVAPYIGPVNHSIHSFVELLAIVALDHQITWLMQYSDLVQVILLATVAGCICLIMLHTCRQKQIGLNPYLLLACTIGALLVPSISLDYKLSILAAPVAILFANERYTASANNPGLRIIFIALTLIFFVAYSSTLFPLTNRPFIWHNTLALMVMLLATTLLCLRCTRVRSGLTGCTRF